MDRRLIIASNRLPVSIRDEHGALSLSRSNGGLATALASLFDPAHSLWVGWTGLRRHVSKDEMSTLGLPRYVTPVNLTNEEITGYYDRFSNGIVWPLAHGLPASVPFSETLWRDVQGVTQSFAEAIEAIITPLDTIWVHDYHLMLLPSLLRQHGVKNRIGFFLHTPFPPPKSAAAIPHFHELVESLLRTDLIGLQIDRDVRRFKKALASLGIPLSSAPPIRSFPIGIDFHSFNSPADNASINSLAAKLRKPLREQTIIFSLSRLDYTKGIIMQLRAFERLLTMYDRHDVTYRLNVAPSRESMPEYQELRQEIETLVESINTTFGTPSWQPIIYSYENMQPQEITAWYRIADIHLNIPIADGMNLIAKEYIAARSQPGVLIISKSMGAARQLSQALIVPAKDIPAITQALHTALVMPDGQKQKRWSALRHEVETHQASDWADQFLRTLAKK